MMRIVEINRNPTVKQLQQFAWIWLAFLGLLGCMAWFSLGAGPASLLWTLAIVVPVLGRLQPAVLKAVYLITSHAAFPIGYLVSHVILAAVYFLVLTPIALILRMAGHDPLARRQGSHVDSYWQERSTVDHPGRYFRQF